MFKKPFIPFSGSGLGTFDSSLEHIGELESSRLLGQAEQSVSVNAANGNLVLQDHTKKLADLGFELSLGFLYNSQAENISEAWRFSQGKKVGPVNGNVNTVGSTVSVTEPDGHQTLYTYDEQRQCYVAQGLAGGLRTLTQQLDESWVGFDVGTGQTDFYNAEGLQTQCQDAAGRTLIFSYEKGRLSAIAGEAAKYLLEYEGTTCQLILAQGTERTLLMEYTFDTLGRLTTTTIPYADKAEDGSGENYSIDYSYEGESAYLTFTHQSDGTGMTFGYDNQGRLHTLSDGENRTDSWDYQRDQTHVTDALGHVTTYGIDAKDRLQTLSRPTLDGKSETTSYGYDGVGHVASIQEPNGGVTGFKYDTLGMRWQTEDADGHLLERYYDPNTGVCYSEVSYVEQGVNHTLTPLVTYFVVNDKRQLRYQIDGQGAVTEYRYDAKGNRTSARVYLGNFFDTKDYKPDQAIPELVLQDWCASQDAANVRLETYAHNSRGQVTDKHIYTAVDKEGQGVWNDATGRWQTSWDAFGHWLTKEERQTATRTATATQSFDGLQRLVEMTDREGHKTTHQYLDSQQKQITTQPNKLQQAITWDHSGLTLFFSEILMITMRRLKD